MSVTATVVRNSHTFDNATTTEFCTATLSGTYATGGFTLNPFAIAGGPGSVPMAGSKVLKADFVSADGHIYVSTVSGNVMTTKIFSAPGTELANGAALPDATISLILRKTKV